YHEELEAPYRDAVTAAGPLSANGDHSLPGAQSREGPSNDEWMSLGLEPPRSSKPWPAVPTTPAVGGTWGLSPLWGSVDSSRRSPSWGPTEPVRVTWVTRLG